MKLLLDTHTYLWLRLEPKRLPATVTSALVTPGNTSYFSLVSLWEMTIKSSKGRLRLPASNMVAVLEELKSYPITILPIDTADLAVLESLPHIHKDPFDRLLVAQAKRHGLTLVTDDGILPEYGVSVLWN